MNYQEKKVMKMNENRNKRVEKSIINWYPGHMAKTRREIIENLKIIDIVIELLDARIPVSSQNPDIAEIIKNKKKIIVLNKCDLADEEENKKWVSYFENKGIPAVLVDANTGKGIDNVIKKIEKAMEEKKEQEMQKGRIGKKIRAMILRNTECWKIFFYK